SQTSPLIDWYKQEGQYQHIKGQGALEEIFADVCAAIDAAK
ncbi:MAG: adenylate kinase, partial [Bacteroides cellulosilyticus]|nr:adenylate kinase [Bacteroides cellulosilyticus]